MNKNVLDDSLMEDLMNVDESILMDESRDGSIMMNDDSMTKTGEKDTEGRSKMKPMQPKPWDIFITILESRKKMGKDNTNIPVKKIVMIAKYGKVRFGKVCATYRHVFKQQKRGGKCCRKLTQQMIEEAQTLGFDFDWDEEKDKEKQKKKKLLDSQYFFNNCSKVHAFYKANSHHMIPDDQPELANWWKEIKQMVFDNTLPKTKLILLKGIPLLTKKHVRGLDQFLKLQKQFDSLSPNHKVRKWREEVKDLACKGAFLDEQIQMFLHLKVFKREDLSNNGCFTSHRQDNSKVSQESSQRNSKSGTIILSSQPRNQGPNHNPTNEGSASTTSASSQSSDGSGMDEIPPLPPLGNQGPNSNPTREGSASTTSASSQSNDGSGMDEIPLPPLGNQGPNSNPTREGFASTTSASSQSNDGSGMDEIPPLPPLGNQGPNSSTGKTLPELKKDASGGFPLASCDCCHNENIPTNHYCMKNVSQGALFVYRGPDGNEPEKQICGKAICFECKEAAGIEDSICPTCFLPIESQEELEEMDIGDLRNFGKRVRLRLPHLEKCRKPTVIPALCETFGIPYKAKKRKK